MARAPWGHCGDVPRTVAADKIRFESLASMAPGGEDRSQCGLLWHRHTSLAEGRLGKTGSGEPRGIILVSGLIWMIWCHPWMKMIFFTNMPHVQMMSAWYLRMEWYIYYIYIYILTYMYVHILLWYNPNKLPGKTSPVVHRQCNGSRSASARDEWSQDRVAEKLTRLALMVWIWSQLLKQAKWISNHLLDKNIIYLYVYTFIFILYLYIIYSSIYYTYIYIIILYHIILYCMTFNRSSSQFARSTPASTWSVRLQLKT